MRNKQAYDRQFFRMRVVLADQSGFTVAEILIAIFIFTVIVTTVFGSYRATSEQVEIVTRNRRLVEMGRNCLDRMTGDLAAIWVAQSPEYTSPGFNAPPDPYRVAGTSDSVGDQTYTMLRFTSFEHLPIRPSRSFGVARIVYYVRPDENDQYNLYRADQLYPYEPFEADPTDPVLCAHVRSFAVMFYDDSGRSYEKWDSESEANDFSTPVAVGIRLELDDEQDERDIQVFDTRVTLSVRRRAMEATAP
ncbi:MAG: hypothetical protein U9Q05_11145 [Thermodesulfobacteriota bacterium]|nr:hypothetical protein [Thermodesulfobacteriota bacterium]